MKYRILIVCIIILIFIFAPYKFALWLDPSVVELPKFGIWGVGVGFLIIFAILFTIIGLIIVEGIPRIIDWIKNG